MKTKRTASQLTRRQLLKTAAVGGAFLAGAPFVRTSHAAGKLTIGIWDHWVPGANDVSRKLMEDWGKKNRVEVTIRNGASGNYWNGGSFGSDYPR